MSSLNMPVPGCDNSGMWFGHPLAITKGGGMETSVLEIQRALLRLQNQQQQYHQGAYGYIINSDFNSASLGGGSSSLTSAGVDSELSNILNRPVKADPSVDYGFGWAKMDDGYNVRSGVTTATTSCGDYNNIDNNSGGLDQIQSSSSCGVVNFAVSRTTSCPPSVPAVDQAAVNATKELGVGAIGTDSLKKRKTALLRPPKPEEVDDGRRRAKKIKGCEDQIPANKQSCTNNTKGGGGGGGGNKINRESASDSGCTSKSKQEDEKPDYIHVRARRGQATDSHSLAERVRRERISERMKYLQDLVPGCSKITGKAGMLDEIINYVQSLQRQVEFLSMKLASVSPALDLSIDELLKQIYAAASMEAAFSSEMMMAGNNIQYDQIQHLGPIRGIDVGMNDAAIRRTTSAPVSYPAGTFIGSSPPSLTTLQPEQMHNNCLAWNNNAATDLQTIYPMEFHQ